MSHSEFHCTSPAKIMLAGEYAVVDGGPALLMAVNRGAVARLKPNNQRLSPFLRQALNSIEEHFGQGSREAAAARRVSVNTDAFQQGRTKVGLGSSAAATVAAIGVSIATGVHPLDQALVHRLAAQAHGDAQAALGARGSGADVACCTFGGILLFERDANSEVSTTSVSLPNTLHCVFPWTGVPASTAPLVKAVQQFRKRDSAGYQECCRAISNAALRLANAVETNEALTAIKCAGDAVKALGEASNVSIWLSVHTEFADIANDCGGVLKPTGAGGGDLALAAFSSQEAASSFTKTVIKRGILCPSFSVDTHGVHTFSTLSK